ncbi:proline--tRNA ligase [Texas Phoenix palm phytoplasma]|uniref:Proline--tRNA ligase n=1 Tax=Texas Phoenix palm phytoplasma TaxID=176709 RepID=A0ABS5BIQ7_9MOLU|nr:proline--tRNA ligase [Texas Phoenix palm phytoplasma]MBP3059470.1 proline--tRNA ligase [Texas Phoenix palm phytoplasma]
MKNKKLVKEVISREKDFSQWYSDVCLKSELIDYSDVKGFFIYLPYGYAIWELIQKFLNENLKKSNHQNVYFPLLLSENIFKKEQEHIKGFSPEMIIIDKIGEKKLPEKLIIRPTSEVLFSRYYSKKINSYRELPKLFNQWCSVVRWEKSNKPFLRSKEFLWQEGHTAHENKEEALKESIDILNLYKKLGKKLLAIPFVSGEKTESEKFKGAEITFSIEALMYDKQALQAGTSHYLGQNFSKAFQIKFQNIKGENKFVEQTSWGVSSRLIGAVIMIHGDDEGLVLPPFLAPIQIVIIPLKLKNPEIIEKSKKLYEKLSKKYRTFLDEQNKNIGWKFSHYELKGVPIRIEIGQNDLINNEITIFTRHNFEKKIILEKSLLVIIPNLLKKINKEMFEKALLHLKQNTKKATNYEEFKNYIKNYSGYVKMSVFKNEAEKIIKKETGATARVILKEKLITQICPVTKKKANQTILFARAY